MINPIFVDIASYQDVEPFLVILQSLYDLVPIALFVIAGVILLRCLYNKMVKGNYVLLAGGIIMVAVAGLLKAIHKFLIGAAQINFIILDKQFTSTQSIGFFLIFLAMIGMFTKFNKNYTKVRNIALPALLIFPLFVQINDYDSSLIFIIMMVVGALGYLGMLIYMAIRLKNIPSIILFAVAIVAMMGMGYLSSKGEFSTAWIQISVNIIYQGCFFAGVYLLKRNSNFMDENCFYKE